MAKQKRHILAFDYECDYRLLGICSHHRDYRLVWSINENLGMHFEKSEDDYVLFKKNIQQSAHPMFEYRNEELFADYYLIRNKHEGKFLIPEKPTIDYFLFVCENEQFEIDPLIQNLKKLNSVLAVYEFDPAVLKSTEHILFD